VGPGAGIKNQNYFTSVEKRHYLSVDRLACYRLRYRAHERIGVNEVGEMQEECKTATKLRKGIQLCT